MTGTKSYLGTSKRDGAHVWRLRVSHNGKQESTTFRVLGEAKGKKAADRALVEFAQRVRGRGTNERSTVRDLWDAWEQELDRLAPTTLRSYRSAMKRTILPALGKAKLEDIDAQTLNAFYREQLERVSPAMVLKYHRILSSMFREAERWGWIQFSPTRNARPPRQTFTEIAAPSLGTVRALAAKADDDKMRLIILLAAALGARRGELCALRWEDFDLDDGTVAIRSSAYEKVGGGVAIKATKTEKPRVVSLDNRIIAALRPMVGRGFVFSNNGETPWRPDFVTKEFENIRLKVPGASAVRFHDLRHFSATQLIAAGVDMTTVSKRLGHAKVSTTVDIYSHARQQNDREAAAILGEVV